MLIEVNDRTAQPRIGEIFALESGLHAKRGRAGVTTGGAVEPRGDAFDRRGRIDPPDGPGTTVCAIDLGSRNFKAVVGRIEGSAIVTRLLDKVRMDLGEHLAENRGSFSEAKISEILDALDSLAARGRAEGASSVLAVGTRALREARNAGAVVRAARAAGVRVEVASGEREAELAYLCATGGAPNRLVSDFGSQSLEIAWRTADAVETRCVDPGYLDAYADWFAGASGFAAARAGYDAFLARNIDRLPAGTRQLLCLASSTAASYVLGRPKEEVAGRPLARGALEETIRTLDRLSPGAWRKHRGSMARAEKVLPGLVVLDHLMRRSGHREAVMVEAELPVGLIVDHLARAGGLPPAGVRVRSG